MIDTDKYETKKKRNWKLKVTYPDVDNSAEAFNGYDTDMPMQGYEDIIAVDSLGRQRYIVAQMVDTGWEDARLIADAPLLLEEVKRLRELLYKCWKQSGESLYYLQVELLNDQEHWYQEMMCDDGSCEDCECDDE